MAEPLKLYRCTRCIYKSYRYFTGLHHLQVCHSAEPGFFLKCGNDGCLKEYQNFQSFRRHLKSAHRNLFTKFLAESENQTPKIFTENPTDKDDVAHTCMDAEADEEMSDVINDSSAYSPSYLVRHLALFLLKYREKHLIPNTVISSLAEDLVSLFSMFQSCVSNTVRLHLKSHGYDVEKDLRLNELLSSSSLLNAFEHVNTVYKLNKYCKQALLLVKPVGYVLNEDQGSNESYHYVPILEVLKKLYQNDEEYAKHLNTDPRETNLTSYSSGTFSG